MGCLSSSPEPTPTTNRPPPRRVDPEAEERRRKEKEEEARWVEIAKKQGPPEPKVPQLPANPTEQQYKQFMIDRFEHEGWENQIILLARKLRAESR
ncbi:Solute carrier organic anion transporter family [Entamoeba marina]